MLNIDQNIQLLQNGSSLTTKESELFQMVRTVCTDFTPNVVARAAGGWVRDKLLGRPSDDLDIAVENTTGLIFAEHLQRYIKSISTEKETSQSKIVVIKANPDQSKHLQTARVCLFSNFWVDICGLRSDTYATDSRIPSNIKQGTPIEDAKRRDFTINALFFNINTNTLEDFVNGVADLKQGILRTPLDAEISFGDDPLRILRAFRFASRFGFQLDESILPASRQVSKEFKRKITRERIVTELTKAIESSTEPETVIEYLVESNLFLNVFDVDDSWHLEENEAYHRVLTVMQRRDYEPQAQYDYFNRPNEQPFEFRPGFFKTDLNDKKLVMILAALFQPIYINDSKGHNKKMTSIDVAIAHKLRFPNKIANEAFLLLTGITMAQSLLDQWKIANSELIENRENTFVDLKRSAAGLWVKEIGSEWKYAKYLALNDELFEFCCRVLEPFVLLNHLEDAYDMKPLLNGTELAELFNVKPGAALREIINDLIKWQLDNPLATGDDYVKYIKSQQ